MDVILTNNEIEIIKNGLEELCIGDCGDWGHEYSEIEAILAKLEIE